MKTLSLFHKKTLFWMISAMLVVSFLVHPSRLSRAAGAITGCALGTTTTYPSGFNLAEFDYTNLNVDNGKLVLQTGNLAIDPDNIVIPFEQEVTVTFLYEGAGYVSDFGWMFYEDAVDGSGNFLGWNNIPTSKRHPIFIRVYDDDETGGCCGGGNGVFDVDYGNGGFPTANEASLSTYDDGTGLNFIVDGDGSVTPKDMKKSLGTIAGDKEIVFFLTADKRWDTTDTDGVFFSKTAWNPDTYTACVPPAGDPLWNDVGETQFDKVYDLSIANAGGTCQYGTSGWLATPAFSRMSTNFGVTLSGTYSLPITNNQVYGHLIVGAPPAKPTLWILGWEDLMGAGDADHNDMVFLVERKTGGIARLKSSQAIVPQKDDGSGNMIPDPDAYFTAVDFEVWDNIPCAGKTDITYYLSIDDGINWVEVTTWDEVEEVDSSGTALSPPVDVTATWTPGTPQYTHRTGRIDFAGLGLSGQALVWKAELVSNDETCAPEIIDVSMAGTTAAHRSFSRSAPVVQGNVLYSTSYETPDSTWTDKELRGHLTASRIYAPDAPDATSYAAIWDAGEVLSVRDLTASPRTIRYPSFTVTQVTGEPVGTGDGTTTTFSGTLTVSPLLSTTVQITDSVETFTDKGIDVLEGTFGGAGSINRYTGDYLVTFTSAPANGTPIVANYTYYATTGGLSTFDTSVTSAQLALDNTYIIGEGYKYDFDGDGDFDTDDKNWLVKWVSGFKDGATTEKEWPLGPIDHSIPAVLTPPGKPYWYFGADITPTERTGYDAFQTAQADRDTVIFVGSRDGMLHAFDGGKFRWGDNPATPSIEEVRGYFLWEDLDNNSLTPDEPNYGTGEELWTFIPANLMPRLKHNQMKGDDRSFVDASPALADVFIDVGSGDEWRTVMLAAEGNGGDTVFCLDITDPANPTFLWEFAAPELFRSRSSPAIAQIGQIAYGGEKMWVAFFVSGKTYASVYPSIYIIDIETGQIIERKTGVDAGGNVITDRQKIVLDVEPLGVGGVPSGQPAVVDSDHNGYIDRIYVGTDKGYMYKVNIPDDPNPRDPDALDPAGNKFNITHCIINREFAVYDAGGNLVAEVPAGMRNQPIYAAPAVVVENGLTQSGTLTYNIRIFFGTSDSPYYDEGTDTLTTRFYFYAYTDHDKKGECGSDVDLEWFYELPAGHRVYASAFAAAGVIYFGTSTAATEDPCDATGPAQNDGKIYAFSTKTGTKLDERNVGNVTRSPIVEDEHLYIKTPNGLISIGSGKYNNPIQSGGIASTTTRYWREIEQP